MDSEESGASIPAGQQIGKTRHLRIQGTSSSSSSDVLKYGYAQQRPQTPPQEPTRLALVSTIQFVSALQKLKEDLVLYEAIIPRSKPLSPGEILGCTAPSLSEVDAILYVSNSWFQGPAKIGADTSGTVVFISSRS